MAFAALVHGHAQAQFDPTVRVCEDLAALEVAWQNFETQDVMATLEEVDQSAAQVSAALDGVAGETRIMSPAAFDQLTDAHRALEAAIDAVPAEATPSEIQDSIAIATENERFAYQNLMGNIACP